LQYTRNRQGPAAGTNGSALDDISCNIEKTALLYYKVETLLGAIT